jgi:nitrogen fixation negative regulator NifL
MPIGLHAQADDQHRVRRLGTVLSVAFAVLALGLIVGFAGTSIYVSEVERANEQLDQITRHQGETNEIITLAQVIDDTAEGPRREELLGRLIQAAHQAEETLNLLLREENEGLSPLRLLFDRPTIQTEDDYAQLYATFLQQVRVYISLHQPGSPFAPILSDHHTQINQWALGPMHKVQKETVALYQDQARSALHKLWLFNAVVLVATVLLVIFIAVVVLRRLMQSARQAVAITVKARDRLAAIIDNIDDGILELSPEGKVTFANRSARRTLSLREADSEALTLHSLTTFSGRDGQAIALALDERQNASAMAVLLRRPDGSCFRAAVTLTSLGEGESAIFTFRDITRHIHREERLRKLSHAVEYSPAQVIITDFTGVIEYVNPSFHAVTGWSLSEVVGRSPRMLSSGAQSPGVYRDMWGSLRNGQPWRGEFRNRRKDGSSYWVRASIAPIKDENGAITHFVAVQEDVTKEVQALRDLETNRRRLREAVSSLPHGFAIYDAEERLAMCNSAYRTMYNHAPDAIKIGASFTDIVRAGYRAGQFTKPGGDALPEEANFFEQRLELFRQGGAREIPLSRGRWVLATETLTPSGEHVCLRTDITQIKAIQRELESARAAADHANTAKSQFLSAMSHELRTPLNAILGFAQLLQMNKKTPLNERQADQVQQILGAGHHLLTLIDEILDLAKIEAGRASLDLEPVNAQTILEDCDGLIRHTAEQAGLTMITERPDGDSAMLWVYADYTRLKQILLNLLSNAVKYNSANGTLWLSVRACSLLENNFDGVEFSVSDSGKGIPTEKRDQLFKPFNRLGQEQSSIQGTGIGLALTHQLIRAMNGTLLVEDRPGGGTEFLVQLPAAPVPGTTTAPLLVQPNQTVGTKNTEAPQAQKRLSPAAVIAKEQKTQDDRAEWECLSGRVLYIGFSTSHRDHLRQALAPAPEVVLLQADSLEKGIQSLEQCPVNVILVEIPNENDSDLGGLAQITSHPQVAALPVAVLTDSSHPSFHARLRRLGFAAILRASPSSQELFTFLAPLLRLSPSESESRSHAL